MRRSPARSRPIALIRDMLIGVSDTPGSPEQAPSGRPTEGRAPEGYGPHRHLPESHWLRQPFTAGTEIVLTGADLSIGDVEAVARGGQGVKLGDDARARMAEARDVVERIGAPRGVGHG